VIVAIPIRVTTTGSAGSASGTGQSAGPVVGRVLGAYYNFHASAPATTDTTLRTKGSAAPSYNLHVISNSATDLFATIAAKPVDNANAAITNAHVPFPVADYLEVSLAQCDALTDAVVVHVLVEVD
jgi:hypothetical protein